MKKDMIQTVLSGRIEGLLEKKVDSFMIMMMMMMVLQ